MQKGQSPKTSFSVVELLSPNFSEIVTHWTEAQHLGQLNLRTIPNVLGAV